MQTPFSSAHRHIAEYLQTPEEMAHDLSLCLAEAGGNAEMLIAIQEHIHPYAVGPQQETVLHANPPSSIGYKASQSITDNTP